MIVGVIIALGDCVVCGELFSFSPDLVPSLLIGGVKRPVCLRCIEHANPVRRARGLPAIIPLPGAYGPEADGDFPDTAGAEAGRS